MTRSSFARPLVVAAVLAAALLVPAGATATGLYALHGRTAHGTTVSLSVDSSTLKVHGFEVHVLMRCAHGGSVGAGIQATAWRFSRYESLHNSLGDEYVSYDAHGKSRTILVALAVQLVRRHSGHVTVEGTFNASVTSHGLDCDTGGNVSFSASNSG